MLAPLIRAMIAAELPVLEAHGLSMWGYSVLVALDRSAIRTQAALAESIGADKTRIIAILDELQQSGLIERVADPEDRRARLLAITNEGRAVKSAGSERFRPPIVPCSCGCCRSCQANPETSDPRFLHQGCESARSTSL